MSFCRRGSGCGNAISKNCPPTFVNLQGSGRPAPRQSLYQVLRCLKGKTGLKHALHFHYDSYVVTALLPVIIPSQGNPGHLVMAHNRRPVRSSYFFNLVDKIILDNGATQFLLRHRFRSGVLKLNQNVDGPRKSLLVPGMPECGCERSMRSGQTPSNANLSVKRPRGVGNPGSFSRLCYFLARMLI